MLFIPFTVGGGIGSLEEIRQLLSQGCDKISINTAALKNPKLITQAARRFGSQCVVVAIDAKRRVKGERSKVKGRESSPYTLHPPPLFQWEVYSHGGRTPTGRDALRWAKEAADRGAGEILLTSMDCDGTQAGYDLALTRALACAVDIPVIASGGAGNLRHLYEALTAGRADAVLAASIFHYRRYTIPEAKRYLKRQGVPVRL